MVTLLQKNWQDLIKPNKLDVQSGRDRSRVATLVAEPLERGFGLTLGNALRRVLLSSLQGAAVKTVQIDGVLHEFSSIPGVREDVTDVVLNIKEVALRLHSEGVKRMVLTKEGPGPARAKDIETSSEVEILNPEHIICHLDQDASVRMEFTADVGKGYVAAERNRTEDAPIVVAAVTRSGLVKRRHPVAPMASSEMGGSTVSEQERSGLTDRSLAPASITSSRRVATHCKRSSPAS